LSLARFLFVCFDLKRRASSWALVVYTYNLSYSAGRDPGNHSLKPAWANSSQEPILKKPITKIGLVEWLKV
jgi:hypothetical protein